MIYNKIYRVWKHFYEKHFGGNEKKYLKIC